MKTKVLYLLSLFLSGALSAQKEGVIPLNQPTSHQSTNHQSTNHQLTNHQTRAVVVGISDYQDEDIPDLQYAHKDAEAFAAWLQSAAGDSLDPDQLRLLINEQATLGNLYKELEWLVDNSREGDWAIIYFSGHGDIEARTRRKEGFLLCYNSPPNNYRTNAFAVYWLQDIIERLSLDKKTRVLVITDACRAGKLAGQEINGAQLTTAALQEQFTNEIKILSCQPNEFSLEGEQWGGGRGAFSYHLLDGLYGLADRNEDDLVTLFEIETYLGDKVPEETAPHRQFPFAVGDKVARLARVDARLLAQLRAEKQKTQPAFSTGDMRGVAEGILAQADSSIQEIYEAYLAAVKAARLMPVAGGEKSANEYYEVLAREPGIEHLHGFLKRHFVAALIDEAQRVTNKLLKTDPQVVSDTWSRPFVFDHIPAYLSRATELLGEAHYLYTALKAKQLYFEAKTYRTGDHPGMSPDSVINIAAGKMENALRYDSNAAYACVELAFLYYYKLTQLDKARIYAEKALALSPNWVYANYVAGNCYRFDNLPKAEFHLHKALELDSTFLLPYQELSMLYWLHGEQEKKLFYQDKFIRKVKALIASDPKQVPVFYRSLLGAELAKANRMEEAVEILQQAGEMSKGQDLAVYAWLGGTYYALGRYEEGLEAAKKQIELAPGNLEGYLQSFQNYKKMNQPVQAIKILEKGLSHSDNTDFKSPFIAWFHALIGEELQELGRLEEAKKQFQKALELLPILNIPFEINFKGRAHLGLGNLEAMEKTIEEGIQKFGGNAMVYYQATTLYSLAKQEQKALEWLEKALQEGMNDFYLIKGEFDLDYLRDKPGFKALLKKYFPDQVKD